LKAVASDGREEEASNAVISWATLESSRSGSRALGVDRGRVEDMLEDTGCTTRRGESLAAKAVAFRLLRPGADWTGL
jgi:hypothetical protein